MREDGEDDLEGSGSLVQKQEERATLAAIFSLFFFTVWSLCPSFLDHHIYA